MAGICTLVDLLQNHRDTQDRGIRFLLDESAETFLSYGDFYVKAREMLYHLQEKGMSKGDELVFQVQDNQTFLYLFWGCLLGGIIPVPVTISDNNEKLYKLMKICSVLNNPVLVTDRNVHQTLQGIQDEQSERVQAVIDQALLTDQLDLVPGREGVVATPGVKDIAFIQFSSGSTGDPKGVMLTHENVYVNLDSIHENTRCTQDDAMISWMPLTHDMGLISVHLAAIFSGVTQLLMHPSLFIKRPTLLLKKSYEHRSTQLYMPNFGYRHMLTHLETDMLEGVELSHVRMIANGAEPISVALCEEFLDALEPYQLRRATMMPVYGLAEASVCVSCTPPLEPYQFASIDRRLLAIGDAIVEIDPADPNAVKFADLGYPIKNTFVRICDEQHRELPEGHIGYVHIFGKNVTQGYYNNPEATARLVLEDGWVITGDLGFLRNGRVVLTGRAKDIIFINGQNFYPHDIEQVADQVEGVIPGRVVASGVYNPEVGSEEVVLFLMWRTKLEHCVSVALDLKRRISSQIGLPIKHVVPIMQIPKTTSGKVQRYKLADEYKAGKFNARLQELNERIAEYEANRVVEKPRNQIEAQLAEIWATLLDVKTIGIYDNFFELGGNSTLIVKMVDLVNERFPGGLSISDAIALQNISEVAACLERTVGDEKAAVDVQELLLAFPDDFFTAQQNGLTDTRKQSFSFALEAELAASLQAMASGAAVTVDDLLHALYAFTVAKVSGQQQIVLPILLPETVVALAAIDLESGADLNALASQLGAAKSEAAQQKLVVLNDVLHTPVTKGSTDLLALVCVKGQVPAHTDLLSTFDYVLETNEQNGEIVFTCDYNSKRLDKQAILDLHESFLDVVEAVVDSFDGGQGHS